MTGWGIWAGAAHSGSFSAVWIYVLSLDLEAQGSLGKAGDQGFPLSLQVAQEGEERVII